MEQKLIVVSATMSEQGNQIWYYRRSGAPLSVGRQVRWELPFSEMFRGGCGLIPMAWTELWLGMKLGDVANKSKFVTIGLDPISGE